MTEDERYLNLLHIFHYVVAALAGVFACFPLIHVAFGVMMLAGVLADGGNAPPRILAWFFVIFPALFILVGLTFAVLVAVAGRFLGRRTHYTYCLVMGGVVCIFVPFGTVLGVFTILVLTRPAVKEMFGVADGEPATEGTGSDRGAQKL